MKKAVVYWSFLLTSLCVVSWAGLNRPQDPSSIPYVRLQSDTPGSAQSGNINVSGTLLAGKLGLGQSNPAYVLDLLTSANLGVRSWSTQGTGVTIAGFFQSDSTSGRGIVAEASASSGTNYGGFFQSNSGSGYGVFAVNNGIGGHAVQGNAAGNLGIGLRGRSTGGSGIGVVGEGVGSSSEGVRGTGAFIGVRALAQSGGYGVFGEVPLGSDSKGVYGFGEVGVFGETTSSTFNASGVFGRTYNGQTVGVQGVAGGALGAGVVGRGQTGGYFEAVGGTDAAFMQGNLSVTGWISKGGGGFKIDHPLDPENKYLYHSFVESPDMKNLYDGNVVTDGQGFAEVRLPAWFDAVNQDFRYQLTVIGQFAQAIIAEKIRGNRFAIRTDKPNVEVSWQVTGIRRDPFAQKHRMPVEEDKEERFRGYYLHPDAYGLPKERRIALFDRDFKTGESLRDRPQDSHARR